MSRSTVTMLVRKRFIGRLSRSRRKHHPAGISRTFVVEFVNEISLMAPRDAEADGLLLFIFSFAHKLWVKRIQLSIRRVESFRIAKISRRQAFGPWQRRSQFLTDWVDDTFTPPAFGLLLYDVFSSWPIESKQLLVCFYGCILRLHQLHIGIDLILDQVLAEQVLWESLFQSITVNSKRCPASNHFPMHNA